VFSRKTNERAFSLEHPSSTGDSMNRFLRGSVALAVSATLAALLAACGGGGADTTTQASISKLRVMGDSLADGGTFGIKFTIQGNDIYPERISQQYGLGKGCNFFSFTGTTFVPNSKAGCTNYAIGGGVINPASGALTTGDPRTISVQIATATAAGNFSDSDLLLVDGGGNDAAALVTAYLGATTPTGQQAYLTLLGTQLTSAQVQAAAAGGAAGFATAGGQYMAALANTFYDQLKAGALDKGAKRLAILNMPGITNTPRFQMVLDSIAAASGGGTAGATARSQSEALFKGWVVAFNSQLATRAAGDSRVAIADFYTVFNEQVANPAQFGLTDAKRAACPVAGVGSDGLPTYNFATCTDAALAALTPPSGATGGANWYKTWTFSDGFHPSAYGHQLLSQLIARTLAQAGWL
jgi:outer membrane lipase/esterase